MIRNIRRPEQPGTDSKRDARGREDQPRREPPRFDVFKARWWKRPDVNFDNFKARWWPGSF